MEIIDKYEDEPLALHEKQSEKKGAERWPSDTQVDKNGNSNRESQQVRNEVDVPDSNDNVDNIAQEKEMTIPTLKDGRALLSKAIIDTVLYKLD